MESPKLSLRSAVLININIMLGAGLFINTTVLAQKAGMCGPLSYALIGILMIPLIGTLMQLLKLHPSGGFYTFGSREISPFAGFLGTWSYATGKLASAVIMIHSSMLFLQSIFPAIAHLNTLHLDVGIIASFIALNMFDIKTNSNIQSVFFVLKLVPVLFGIFVGLFLWFGTTQPALSYEWSNIPFTLPLVLFAMIGFEAACSLSSQIENAAYNAPRAIMISYITVICINFLYQLMISGALGTLLDTFANYTKVLPGLVAMLPALSPETSGSLVSILHLAIVSSALAGSYGIIFTNTWNWYGLAQNNHLFGAKKITALNRFSIPWLCVIIQGSICLIYLAVTQGNQLPLQQTAVLGVTLAYLMSVIALMCAAKKRADFSVKKWVPLFALGNCLLLLGTIGYTLMQDGANSLMVFASLLGFGIWMFWLTPGSDIAQN